MAWECQHVNNVTAVFTCTFFSWRSPFLISAQREKRNKKKSKVFLFGRPVFFFKRSQIRFSHESNTWECRAAAYRRQIHTWELKERWSVVRSRLTGLALSENRCQVKSFAAPHHYSWTAYLRQNPVLIRGKSRRAVGLVVRLVGSGGGIAGLRGR